MAKFTYGTSDNLVASGSSAAVSNNAMSAASAIYTSTAPTNGHGDRPMARIVLSTVAPAAALTAGSTFDIYARPLDINATNDAPTPSTTYKNILVGQFRPDAVGTAQYLETTIPLISKKMEFYILNNATGQTLAAGWALDITPFEIA